jgi:hypothetical protein
MDTLKISELPSLIDLDGVVAKVFPTPFGIMEVVVKEGNNFRVVARGDDLIQKNNGNYTIHDPNKPLRHIYFYKHDNSMYRHYRDNF